MPEWIPADLDDLENDEPIDEFEGWTIAVIAPNGGILGASISKGSKAWQMMSDGRYHDTDWHLQQAIQFIQSMSDRP